MKKWTELVWSSRIESMRLAGPPWCRAGEVSQTVQNSQIHPQTKSSTRSRAEQQQVAMADSPELARARDALAVNPDHHAQVDALSSAASAFMSSSDHLSPSFFEGFALRGIRVLRIHPGFIHCSYTVPPSLTDSTTGCLAAGAVVALVDEICSAVSISDAQNLKVSVDMSVAFTDLSQARPGDNLSITTRALGHKGAYSGTHVLFTNADTGNVVAEGRHSLFGNMKKAPPPKPATAHRSNM